MKSNHPYTDRTTWLTESAYLTPPVQTRWTTYCEVRFRAAYAAAVNYGVPGRSRPYPFIPQGMYAAERVALARCTHVLQVFCNTMGR